MKHVLAGIKDRTVNEPLIASFKHLSVAMQLANIESIADNVRKRSTMEAWLTRAVDVSFALQLVRQSFESVAARCIEIEYTN
ncbi:MAG: hypothetical protein R3C09_19920 [Pirellulaceae bacterium]